MTTTNRKRKRILAIAGSLRTGSSDAILLEAAVALAPEDVAIVTYSGLGILPYFNPDLDREPAPFPVAEFRSQLRESHAVVVSSPEYAHGIPGILKNALDWIVGSGELYDKPVALFSPSPRATYVRAALMETLTVMGAKLVPEACITVPLPRQPEGDVIVSDPKIAPTVRAALVAMADAIGINLPDVSGGE